MSEPSSTWPTLTIAVGLLSWAAAVRFRRGAALAPFSLTVLMLVAIFGIRPIMMIRYDTFDVYGLDVVTGFNATARLGFVAVTCLCVAYFYSRVTDRRPSTSVPVRRGWQAPTIDRAVAVCMGTVLSWFAAIVIVGGGPGAVGVLFRGRSSAAAAALGNTPVAVFCLPIAGAVLVAAARIATERTRRLTVRERILFWVAVLGAVVPPASLGGRRFILPCVLVALVAVAAPKWSKPITAKMVLLGVGSLLVLAAIPFIRSAGARKPGQGPVGALIDYFSTTGVTETLKALFLTYDTDSFGYVAYFQPRLGDGIPYGHGRSTVGDLLVNALPVQAGELWSDHLLRLLFGATCARGVCPVASVVGVLALDFGLPAVVFGCLLLGLVYGRFERRLLAADGLGLAGLLVVAGFAPVFARGSSMSTAWIAVNVVVIVTVLLWLFGRRPVPEPVGPKTAPVTL